MFDNRMNLHEGHSYSKKSAVPAAKATEAESLVENRTGT